jgi:MFS family permease
MTEDSHADPDESRPLPRGRTAAHDPYAALRLRDFRLFLIASVVASIGVEMQAVTVGWELYERTRSALVLGLVGLVQIVPVLVLALPAGHVADRYNRKHVLLVAQAAMALASLGLAALSHGRGPLVLTYGCLLLAGTAAAFSRPARWSLVPQLVPLEHLGNALTWNSSGWQFASVAGPGLGGVVMAARHDARPVYLLAALCSCLLCVLVVSISVRRGSFPHEPISLRSLLAGFRFVWASPLILATITLDLFAVLLGGATTLLPIFARDILHIGPGGLGWLRAAPSVGAFSMALLLAHRPPLGRSGVTLLWAVAGFGAATIGFGLSRWFWLSWAMLFLTGALDNISVVVRSTLMQVLTPDAMRGRVSAVNSVFVGSSNELGGFESGLLAQLFGPVASVVAGGIGTLLVVLAVALGWPQVRQLGMLYEAKPAPLEEV